jgi:hypothetical protein
MSKVKAILIDPFRCVVEHVEVDRDDHRSYYPLLSHETMPVDTFTVAYPGVLKGHDALFVDDEGLMKDAQRWFGIATGHQAFAGKGLIVGANANGDAGDAETSLDIVRVTVVFAEMLDPKGGTPGLYATRTPWVPEALD